MSRLLPLPHSFLKGLEGQEEVLVTSRDRSKAGTVPVWFVVDPQGFLYLFSQGFSIKARRWQRDPWVRLCNRRSRDCIEGRVEFLEPEQSGQVADLVASRWADWGVLHPEGLRQMLAGGTHVLVRVGIESKTTPSG